MNKQETLAVVLRYLLNCRSNRERLNFFAALREEYCINCGELTGGDQCGCRDEYDFEGLDEQAK